ncbi:PA2778 family cysteine peptidase [Pistricoccus aurantiacus]|uniref:PA2778 family cysteine peptidase n=1 Tax=Pistricoccus aurantiacus TaxID=1883414 RepID=UPI001FE95DD5|nr:PA2778 family cysteine peptidase [Pistricoccus aurantiacus]
MLTILLALTGCATEPRLSNSVTTGLPQHVLLDGTPFHGQRDYQCGPASLAMVLETSGVDASVDALIPQVFLPDREGSVQPEMQAAVRRYQRISYVIDNDFDALLEELAAGHPVVVMQNLALPVWPLWHYAVAIGYDLPAREIILHTGMTPGRATSFRTFDSTWARSDRWGMVALAPGELPASIEPSDAMEAIADFEKLNGAAAALPAWEALTRRFPNYAMGWFALGNARHAHGDFAGTIEAFQEAVWRDPGFAAAWLNLGLMQKSLEHKERARQALQRAASLSGKWQDAARRHLDRL